jgi:hypothetical protein
MRRLVCACVAGFVLASAPGTAASGWRIQFLRGVSLSYGGNGVFAGVSCTSATFCAAMGSNSGVLAVRLNGTRWSIQRAPSPAVAPGEGAIEPGGVSCTSRRACLAVGSYVGQSNDIPFAERWDGMRWSIQNPLPVPGSGLDVSLYAVSCASPSACTAVGSSVKNAMGAGDFTLAERWNGSRWAIQPTPTPSGNAELYGVSCTSPSACTAIGYYATGPDYQPHDWPLAERWNGNRWYVQKTPKPRSPGGIVLYGVSCTSRRTCTAVGGTGGNPSELLGGRTVAERWNGRRWWTTPALNIGPASLDADGFNAVSCAAATACLAVGSGTRGRTGNSVTVAELWNGRRWTIQYPAQPVRRSDRPINLDSVSCPSSTACTALGDWEDAGGADHAFVDRWTASGSPHG